MTNTVLLSLPDYKFNVSLILDTNLLKKALIFSISAAFGLLTVSGTPKSLVESDYFI